VLSVVDDPKAAMSAGADSFLAKPVPPFTLLNTVRKLVEGANVKTVLLADDDEVTRYLLGETLAKLGFRILEAHNGREAIQIAKDYIPSAVILDLVMPDLSGFDVLREIRNNSSTKEIPVIIRSSKDLSSQERALLAEMGAFIYPKQAFSGDAQSEGFRQILDTAGMKQ